MGQREVKGGGRGLGLWKQFEERDFIDSIIRLLTIYYSA